MKIETLIAKIQTDKTNGGGTIPPDIMDAVTGLVSRLDGMLPDVETARRVATSLGIAWRQEPSNATLAWAWTVWPAYETGRIAALGATVAPLLPPGQPFGQAEVDDVRADLLLAEVAGDGERAKKARRRAARMIAHEEGMN